MSKLSGKSAQLLAFLLGGVALFGFMAYSLGFWGSSSRVVYYALLDDAAGIVANNAVKVAGVSVGRVSSVGVEGQMARLELRIDESLALHQDSKVSVRAKSLLGEKYIQLDPGVTSSAILTPGSKIAQGGGTFEVDQLLNSLRSVMGDEEPLSQRLSSLLARSDRLMARLEDPEVEAAMQADLERVRRLLDETGALAKSMRLVLDGQEAHLKRKLRAAATWMGDPRWPKIVTRLDNVSRALEQELPTLLESTRETAQASSRLMSRADQSLDPPTMRALASSIRDFSDISSRGKSLAKDIAVLQRKLKKGPLRGEEIGALLHALNQISQRAAQLDPITVRRFLQREGVKVYFGTGSDARKKLRSVGAR